MNAWLDFVTQIASAKSWSVERASHQPAYLSCCLTISFMCLLCLLTRWVSTLCSWCYWRKWGCCVGVNQGDPRDGKLSLGPSASVVMNYSSLRWWWLVFVLLWIFATLGNGCRAWEKNMCCTASGTFSWISAYNKINKLTWTSGMVFTTAGSQSRDSCSVLLRGLFVTLLLSWNLCSKPMRSMKFNYGNCLC